jgi:hydroxypyruvate isomerase
MPKPSPVRFSANLSFLFKDVAFSDRFRRAALAGFGGVEFMWPGAQQVDPVAQAITETGLEVACEKVAWAAEQARTQGVDIMIEAVNSYENGPYLLDTTAKAVSFLDAVGADNVKLQYDVYHMQRMEGNLADTITRVLPRIGHVQIADPPRRTEPGTGEVNYRFVLGLLERTGYGGWVGLEYNPTTPTTEESFGWMRELGYA